MKLIVYKGFNNAFLEQLSQKPLIESAPEDKKNVLEFTKGTKRRLEASLIAMDDRDERWVTYEEFSLIKENAELAVKNYDLEICIYINNLYPEYYPIEFPIADELENEIENIDKSSGEHSQSPECEAFYKVFSSALNIEGTLYASFYNFELEKCAKIKAEAFYAVGNAQTTVQSCDMDIHITNDISLYLKDLNRIIAEKPRSVGYRCTKGLITERNLNSFLAFCAKNKISASEQSSVLDTNCVKEDELINIAKNVIKIPNFQQFRELKFYKNPDINNETENISQGHLISQIISQAEKAYSEKHDYRDIFITASTGAGKSVMFQIPAIYLAQKYHKLTIIIEPVKALMEDQKKQLNSRGYYRVDTFNSNLITQSEKEEVLKRIKEGTTDLLYLSPETLLSYSIETLIGDREIGLIIIDEAHIVTTWGMGFRPDYWYLGGYINSVRNRIQTSHNKDKKIVYFPICAFTATAVNGGIDDSVSETVVSLYMENPIKYLGYVRRDNISFDIEVKNEKKSANNVYEEQKAIALASRINEWSENGEKTIVYFPYASYAKDAYQQVKSFADRNYSCKKVTIYTGKDIFDESAEDARNRKQEAFDAFRSGEKPIMLATKAFGMGVDISDIANVYHYAVTGNLSDYVQEVGRAARKVDSKGCAITDYFYNDISFMDRLFGMSQIRQYQINLVLSGIYNTYKSKNGSRNFLISPDAFTYIFAGRESADSKNAQDKQDKQVNKLKTCLLMLEKDLFDKYNFKVLISRPQSVFTKAFVVIKKENEREVLKSKYGKYFKFIAAGRQNELQNEKNNLTVTDIGDVYSLDLKAVWEEHYQMMSFPKFKFCYFNAKTPQKNKVEIMPEIIDSIAIRQMVSVKTKNDLLLCELREKILQDFDYIADVLYNAHRREYFSNEEFLEDIRERFGTTKSRIIANSLFALADPNGKCVKVRTHEDRGGTEYTLSNGTLKELLRKTISASDFVRNLKDISSTEITKYLYLDSESKDAIALKMLSVFDYITYEVAGGEEPEVFIRLNDPEKIRRIVNGEIKYSNSYVTRAKQKHDREVKILRKFFSDHMNDTQRWDYIEQYFLGGNVLEDNNVTVIKKHEPLTAYIDKSRSNVISADQNWGDISVLFDDKFVPIIDSIERAGIPMPDYTDTKCKKDILGGDIVMTWPEKNVLVFAEDIGEDDANVCEEKGWTAFELISLDSEKLKEALA